MSEHETRDAVRLERLKRGYPTISDADDRAYWGEGNIAFLIRKIAARDAALRDALAEIAQYRDALAAARADHVRAQDGYSSLAGNLADMQRTFDHRWKADMRAIERWRAESPPERDLVWPDHADLVVWLLEELDSRDAGLREYRTEIARATASLQNVFKSAAPQCESFNALLNICTQIDNLVAGQKAEIERLKAVAEAARKVLSPGITYAQVPLALTALNEALAALDAAPGPERPDLNALIKKANDRFNALPPQEQAEVLRAQRISWVYGNLALSGSPVTKEQVTRVIDETMASSPPVSRDGDQRNG